MVFQTLVNSLYNNFKKRNEKHLRKLADDFLDESIMRPSKLFFELAVISYVFSKILSKPRFLTDKYKDEFNRMEQLIKQLNDGVGKKSDEEFFLLTKKVEDIINSIESQDKRFFIGLLAKGRVKNAATMYAKGVSLGLAAEVSGVGQQEIQKYSGDSMMFDRLKEETDIRERMKKVRRLLER
ncbi:MAG: hypothetical protein V1492_01465 [Candidatus Micrarchaeota archaeon]